MMRALVLLLVLSCSPAFAEVTSTTVGGFESVHETVVPGTPMQAWGEFTGDVSGWWDHTQSEHPVRLVLDGHVGGYFYEHFDEGGENGAIHARVIYADAGRKLILDGPLGLSGYPIDLAITVTFEAEGEERTRVAVVCRGAGQVEEGWPETVDRVWRHFLIERFEPWMVERFGGR